MIPTASSPGKTREWTLWVVAALLYLPFSSWALIGAARDGVPPKAIGTAMAAGTVMMFSVVLAARWLSQSVRYGG